MISACGRYVTIFNGEIYNLKELRALLKAADHTFRATRLLHPCLPAGREAP